jgi:phospholipase C
MIGMNGRACDGWPEATTSMQSAITQKRISRFSAPPRKRGRASTGTSHRSWPKRSRTASISIAVSRIDWITRSSVPRCRRSGIGSPGADLDGRYYFSDSPFLGLWRNRYLPIMRSYEQFLADCASGELPHVAFVDPRFGGEQEGISNDDHPHDELDFGAPDLTAPEFAVPPVISGAPSGT